MIVSVSRRTDILAFYARWFVNRVRHGFVEVPNPFNPKQIKTVSLALSDVDCFVFWTKNPLPMLQFLDELAGYHYYFLFTLNNYPTSIEAGLPPLDNRIEAFCSLADKIGRNRVIWRYDPILFSENIDANYHKNAFEYIISRIHRHTSKCIVSFVDLYSKTKKALHGLNNISDTEKHDILYHFHSLCLDYGLDLQTCSEDVGSSSYPIKNGACIDAEMIFAIKNKKMKYSKDRGQRKNCLCTKSIDIGVYNTCIYNCKYCYAIDVNSKHRNPNHDVHSTSLNGRSTTKELEICR